MSSSDSNSKQTDNSSGYGIPNVNVSEAATTGKSDAENEEVSEFQTLKAMAQIMKDGVKDMGRFSAFDLAVGLKYLKRKQIMDREPENNDEVLRYDDLVKDNLIDDLRWWGKVSDLSYLDNLEQLVENSYVRKEQVLVSKFSSSMARPAHFLFVDDKRKKVALAIRGTWSARDIVTDLAARAEDFLAGQAHAGMLDAAQWFDENLRDTVKQALDDNEGYSLVVCGHSLGGGVAALVSYMWKEEFHDVKCYTFGSASCVTPNLAKIGEHWITSIVCGFDIVPRSSVASLEALRKELAQYDWSSDLKKELAQTKPGRWIKALNDTIESSERAQKLSRAVSEAQNEAKSRISALRSWAKEKYGKDDSEDEDEKLEMEDLTDDEKEDVKEEAEAVEDAAREQTSEEAEAEMDKDETADEKPEPVRMTIPGKCYHLIKVNDRRFLRAVTNERFWTVELADTNASDHSMVTYLNGFRDIVKYYENDEVFEHTEGVKPWPKGVDEDGNDITDDSSSDSEPEDE